MNDQSEALRVFVALDIPPHAKTALAEAIQQLQSAVPSGVRWVDPAGIHLTLKFLGNVEASMVEAILAAMQQASAGFGGSKPHLTLSGLGVFPNASQPRVLWAGAEGDLDSLGSLQGLVDEAISKLGFEPEKRPFHPHLAIGRVRDGVPSQARRSIGEAIARTQLPPVEPWEIEAVHLIQSNRTSGGAVYTSLGSVPL